MCDKAGNRSVAPAAPPHGLRVVELHGVFQAGSEGSDSDVDEVELECDEFGLPVAPMVG